jgi:hypothetical protein
MKRTLLRLKINFITCMVLLLTSVISFNCIESPSKLVGPTYDTQLSIPVLDTTNYFSEFVKNESMFVLNPADSTYSTIFSLYPIDIDTITNRKIALGEYSAKGFSTTLKNISAIDGTMNFEFTNRIPIALSFQARFLKWDSTKAHSDTLFSISRDSLIKAPAVDTTTGFAINPKISNIAVIFTGEQIDKMPQADSIFINLYFYIGNELKWVKFKKDDYIRTRSSISARFTINKPQRENGK